MSHFACQRAGRAAMLSLLDDVEQRLAARSRETNNLQTRETSLRDNIRQLEQNLSKTKSERSEVDSTLQRLRAEFAAKSTHGTNLEKALADRSTERDCLQKELDELKFTLANSDTELSRLQRDLSVTSERAESFDAALTETKEALEVARTIAEEKSRELEETIVTKDKAVSDRERVTKALTDAQNLYRQLQNDMHKEKERFKAQAAEMEELKATLERKRTKKREWKAKYMSLTEEQAETQQQVMALNRQLSEAEEQALEAKRLYEETSDKLSQLTLEHKQKSEEAERVIASESEAREVAERQNAEARAKLEETETTLSDLRADHAQLAEDREQIERMLTQAQAVRSFLQGEIAALKTRAESLKNKHQEEVEKNAQLARDLATAKESLGGEMQTLLSQHNAQREELMAKLEEEQAGRRADVDMARMEADEKLSQLKEKYELEAKEQRDYYEGRLEREMALAASAETSATNEQEAIRAALEERLRASQIELEESRERLQRSQEMSEALRNELEAAKAEAEALEQEKGDAVKQNQKMTMIARWSGAAHASVRQQHEEEKKYARSSKAVFAREASIQVYLRPATMLPLVMQIYCEKIAADIHDDSDRFTGRRQTLEDFVYDFFLFKFGLKHIAEEHLKGMVTAIETGSKESKRLLLFARLLGVIRPLPPDSCDFLLTFISRLFGASGGPTKSEFLEGSSMISVDSARAAIEASFSTLGEERVAAVVRSATEHREPNTEPTDPSIHVDELLERVMESWEVANDDAEETLAALFTEADANGDGVLVYEEFAALVEKVAPAVKPREVKTMFREALVESKSGSRLNPQAFAITMRAKGHVTIRSRDEHTPIARPLEFSGSEWGLLCDSWDCLEPLVLKVMGGMEGSKKVETERASIETQIEALKDLCKKKTSYHQAWVLYRRLLTAYAINAHRNEVHTNETLVQESGSAAYGGTTSPGPQDQ